MAKAAPNPSRTLTALGLSRIEEALLCVPSGVVDCRGIFEGPPQVHPGENVQGVFRLCTTGHIEGFDSSKRLIYERGGKDLSGDRLFDAAGGDLGQSLKGVFRLVIHVEGGGAINIFGNPWPFKNTGAGETFVVAGSFARFGPTLSITNPDMVPYRAVGKLWVRYKGIPGKVSGASVEALVREATSTQDAAASALRTSSERIACECGMPPAQVLAASGCAGPFQSLDTLLRALHAPKDPDQFEKACESARRISALALQCAAFRRANRPASDKAPVRIEPATVRKLAAAQKETLTDEQMNAALEIARLMGSSTPSSSMLSADVGCGKTLTFVIPAVAAHKAGASVAVLAPTQILANQLAEQFTRRFPDVAVERVLAGKKIANPKAILVGTGGLGTACKKAGVQPNLLICDEQHKMAVKDKAALTFAHTHVLEVSATPIPGTLAGVLFGGVRILTLKKSPVAREIGSFVLDTSPDSRKRVLRKARDILDAGARVAFVYPRVTTVEGDGDAGEGAQAPQSESFGVIKAAQSLAGGLGHEVGVLHGQLGDDETAQTLARFRAGDLRMVVASTILETGIDVPDIRMLVVRDADHFGVSQLHQLRGRLARNGGKALFVMMTESLDAIPDETLARLDKVANCTDGFELAEFDLQQRGFGAIDGEDQSGKTDALFKLTRLRAADFLALAGAGNDAEQPDSMDMA